MKKKILAIVLAGVSMIGLSACSEKDRVESNLTKEADNFNVVR